MPYEVVLTKILNLQKYEDGTCERIDIFKVKLGSVKFG